MGKVWMIGAASALGVLLLVSVVVALTERETDFEPGTPEATIQQFLKAMGQSEYESAYGMLASNLQVDCGPEQMFTARFAYDDRFENNRVTLEETHRIGESTFVTLRITEFRSDGPFGSSESSHEQRYALKSENGDWRFSEFPWPLYNCGSYKSESPVREIPVPSPTPTPTPVPTPTA
tara:strand:+ start:161 stop:694 length:534 start_codon:yes stop_codon:yes gene_type:complete